MAPAPYCIIVGQPGNEEDVKVEILLDHTALHAQVHRAARNKNGISIDGPVLVRVVERRKRG